MITSKPFSRNFWHLPKITRKNRSPLLTDVKWLHTYYRHIILLLQVDRWMHQSVIDEREKAKGSKNPAVVTVEDYWTECQYYDIV